MIIQTTIQEARKLGFTGRLFASLDQIRFGMLVEKNEDIRKEHYLRSRVLGIIRNVERSKKHEENN